MFGWTCTTYPEPSAGNLSWYEAQDDENGRQHYQGYIGCDDPRSLIRCQVGPRRSWRYGGHGAEVAASDNMVSGRRRKGLKAFVADRQIGTHKSKERSQVEEAGNCGGFVLKISKRTRPEGQGHDEHGGPR